MASGENADALALLFSLLGGFFMGAYPVPIKAPSVIKAAPHAVIFQCYKTFWVFLAGWIFVLANAVRGVQPVYEFTFWGIVSAMAWIPSGLSTISAVPRLGVGMAIAVSTGTASVLSFLVFWLVLGEPMKEHEIGSVRIYTAPIYLVCIVIGMGVLVAAPGLCKRRQPDENGSVAASVVEGAFSGSVTDTTGLIPQSDGAAPRAAETRRIVSGLIFAVMAGVFSALQYGAVNLGKKAAQRANGCEDDADKCPDTLKEQFNSFGSWETSFGIGALLVTTFYVVAFGSHAKLTDRPLPQLHFQVLRIPGSLAGWLWVLGNLFQTAAVARGGNAVMVPANQGIQLVTSGAFGLLYYCEVRELSRALLWTLAALWTLAFIILLSRETH